MGKLFEPSLLWWRLLRVAADATAAVLVYALVREHRPALGARRWAAAARHRRPADERNPTAPALAFALAAVLLATRGRPAGRARWRRSPRSGGPTWARSPRWPPRRRCCGASRASRMDGADRRATPSRPRAEAASPGPAAGRRRDARADVRCSPSPRSAPSSLLYAPFLVAAGPGTVWDALVVQATRDGEWWRLPFPAGSGAAT